MSSTPRYLCPLDANAASARCCTENNGTIAGSYCDNAVPSLISTCYSRNNVSLVINNNGTLSCDRKSGALQLSSVRGWLIALMFLLSSLFVQAETLSDVVIADAQRLGIDPESIWRNPALVSVVISKPPLVRRGYPERPVLGSQYINATFEQTPLRITVTYDRTKAVGNGTSSLFERQCHYKLYIREQFDAYWSGEWDNSWQGHCDVYAWGGSSSCIWWSLSETTTYSVNLSIGWKDIISSTLGVQRDYTSTNGRQICATSCEGCVRLWTSNKMKWAHGTMWTHTYESTTCDTWNTGGNRIKSERVDNIHIDAGKRDDHGLLVVTPGGSPCSDGPDWCGVKNWGRRCQ